MLCEHEDREIYLGLCPFPILETNVIDITTLADKTDLSVQA